MVFNCVPNHSPSSAEATYQISSIAVQGAVCIGITPQNTNFALKNLWLKLHRSWNIAFFTIRECALSWVHNYIIQICWICWHILPFDAIYAYVVNDCKCFTEENEWLTLSKHTLTWDTWVWYRILQLHQHLSLREHNPLSLGHKTTTEVITTMTQQLCTHTSESGWIIPCLLEGKIHSASAWW